MINTLKPSAELGHDDKRGEILEKIANEYGKPEEKQREAVKKLGKDEFFKIMVTQIQHQDPLKPYQNEQMAAQMAQFTSLEQMINVNNNLEKLTQAQQPIQNMSAAHLIGKHVTADSSRILHTEGKKSEIKFDLAADANRVRVNILNDRGESVKEFEEKDVKKGAVTLAWDGKKANKFVAPSGNYILQITAYGPNDKSIQVNTQKTEPVTGVAFEGKETILLVGDPKNPQKMPLRNIHKVVDPTFTGAASSGAANGISVSGLPPGMQIEGLENLVNKAANEKAAAENQTQNTENQDDGEKTVSVSEAAKYMPINVEAFHRAQEKPVVQQAPSQEEIKKMIAAGPDLSDANPLAAAIKSGVVPGANSAGKTIQPSQEGSVAGKWTE